VKANADATSKVIASRIVKRRSTRDGGKAPQQGRRALSPAQVSFWTIVGVVVSILV